jgi:hypothetical protein
MHYINTIIVSHFYLKQNVLETGFSLRLQVKTYPVGPFPDIGTSSSNWAQLNRFLPEERDRIQSLKCYVLNKRHDDV